MVKSILDTDILSEYLKGHDLTVIGRASRYAKEHGVFTFTSVTVYESLAETILCLCNSCETVVGDEVADSKVFGSAKRVDRLFWNSGRVSSAIS